MTPSTAERKHSRVIEKSPVYYGWVILAVGTIGVVLSSPGQTYSFSIFIEEFIRDLGVSRSLISGLYTVGTIGGSLALPFIGRQIDRRGSRTMAVVIGLTFGLACIYMSTVRSIAMILVGFIAMRMLGQSSMVIVSHNVMNQWWVRRRGFVLGISTLVSAVLGTGLFPNFINWLIPMFGWRMAYVILGVIVISIMVPIGYLFFREKPELFGLKPDGNFQSPPLDNELTSAGEQMQDEEPLEVNWTAGEAVRTSAFWLIVIGIGSFSMLGTGLTFHIVSIFGDNGLSPSLAAAVFLPMSITTSLFSIPGGWLIDRVEAKYMLSVGLVLLTVTILFSASIGSPALGVVYGIVFGLTNGFARVISNVIWANYFGRENLGSISGLTSTFGSASSGLGPLIYGVGRDLAGSYWPSLWISALLPATMALLVLFMKRPVKE
ncbi:MAG: MFS transporter [Chloroflexota bacterium]